VLVSWWYGVVHVRSHQPQIAIAANCTRQVRKLVDTAATETRAREPGDKETEVARREGHDNPMLNIKLRIFAHIVRKYWTQDYDWIFWTDAGK
jgi:hypothetical protein